MPQFHFVVVFSCITGKLYTGKSEKNLPGTLISQSGKPAAAAVEATPTRKLWPLRLW